MVRTFLRKPRISSTANERTLVLDDGTHHEPRYRDFSAEEESTPFKKEWVPHAVEMVPVAMTREASLLSLERRAIFSRANGAPLYYAAKEYSRRSGMDARDDVHEADRSVHQRRSFASNRFTSSGIDDVSQDSESDSGVELEYYKYYEQEESQRSSHGFMKIISSMFRLRSSKQSLTDTTQEGTSFDDSASETGSPPEMETVEFMTDSCLEATSTISESTDGGSNASNLASEEENENKDNESSDEEEDDDLFEDGLFNDYEEGWNDRMLNCLCTCK